MLLSLAAPLLGMPMAAAQMPGAVPIYSDMRMDAAIEPAFQLVAPGASSGPYPGAATIRYHANDLSIERSTGTPLDMHAIEVRAAYLTPNAQSRGWPQPIPTVPSGAGRAPWGLQGQIDIVPAVSTDLPEVRGVVTFLLYKVTEPSVNTTIEAHFTLRLAPLPNALIDVLGGDTSARPYQDVKFRVRITNTDFYAANYRLRATIIDADGITGSAIPVHGAGSYFLMPQESIIVDMGFRAPREKFWYNGDVALVSIAVEPADTAGPLRTTGHIVEMNGFYLSENLVLLVIVAIAQAFLFVWLILFAKRTYEKRYLGRPIPPWEIPEERSYLERLKREDPRAHYVTRYFLMEEEHRSALLWFYTYKRQSKRQLKAEIRAMELRERADELSVVPVERFDRRRDRIQRRYGRRIERAHAALDAKIQRLQDKLERNFDRDFEKDHAQWEKKVAKLKKKYDKPYHKAKKKWEKETQKILAKWEKPWKKDQEKYEASLAKAKEAYAKKVKKGDKETWKAWRLQMEDWESENKLRKREGRELLPEPPLLSQVVGPPISLKPSCHRSSRNSRPSPSPAPTSPCPPSPGAAHPSLPNPVTPARHGRPNASPNGACARSSAPWPPNWPRSTTTVWARRTPWLKSAPSSCKPPRRVSRPRSSTGYCDGRPRASSANTTSRTSEA
jgi:hypothetical protein